MRPACQRLALGLLAAATAMSAQAAMPPTLKTAAVASSAATAEASSSVLAAGRASSAASAPPALPQDYTQRGPFATATLAQLLDLPLPPQQGANSSYRLAGLLPRVAADRAVPITNRTLCMLDAACVRKASPLHCQPCLTERAA